MDYFFRVTAPFFWYAGLPFLLIIIVLRIRWSRQVTWRYSMGALLAQHGLADHGIGHKIVTALQGLLLVFLLFFMGKPQLVDERSLLSKPGIDIVLVLDVSGSMQFVDDQDDGRSRFQVAKEEAIRFVQKRDNDAIGLVIFGNDAVTRSPITHDKKSLEHSIRELELGFINPEGTVLATSMMTALNRMRYSKAKSRVMIVLTDGEPSENDQKPDIPIEVAKQLGIKIYTVGIGSDKPRRIFHPHYGIVMVPTVNKLLLERIAQQTGGQFFQAANPKDMRMIYDTIDTLEREEHDVPIFTRFYELFMWYGAQLMWLVLLIVILSTWMWFGL